MGEPARGYKWADATPGNTIALKHGVWSARRAEQVAHEVEVLAAETALTFPWTAPYDDERRAYARALLDERDIRSYLDQVGMLDEDHQERPAVRTLARFSAIAASRRAALGLSPMAHARLLALVAEVVAKHPERAGDLLSGSLDSLVAQGRAALEAGSGGAES
ncbi:MAG: hypothetical protein ABSB68_10090 [Acidimicrobiales bacterium]|jgi:hypothetical protein